MDREFLLDKLTGMRSVPEGCSAASRMSDFPDTFGSHSSYRLREELHRVWNRPRPRDDRRLADKENITLLQLIKDLRSETVSSALRKLKSLSSASSANVFRSLYQKLIQHRSGHISEAYRAIYSEVYKQHCQNEYSHSRDDSDVTSANIQCNDEIRVCDAHLPRDIASEIVSFEIGTSTMHSFLLKHLLSHWTEYTQYQPFIYVFSWLETIGFVVFCYCFFHKYVDATHILAYILLGCIALRVAVTAVICYNNQQYLSTLRQLKQSLRFQISAPIELFLYLVPILNISVRDINTMCRCFEKHNIYAAKLGARITADDSGSVDKVADGSGLSLMGALHNNSNADDDRVSQALKRTNDECITTFVAFMVFCCMRNVIFEFFVVIAFAFYHNYFIWSFFTYFFMGVFVTFFFLTIKTRFSILFFPIVCFMLAEHFLSTMYLLNTMANVSCLPTSECTPVFGDTFLSFDDRWLHLHASFWMAVHFLIIVSAFVLTIVSHFACFIWPNHVQKGAAFFIMFWDGMCLANICYLMGLPTLSWAFFVFGGCLHIYIAVGFLVEALPIFWFFPDDEIAIIDPLRLETKEWMITRYKTFFFHNYSRAIVEFEMDNDNNDTDSSNEQNSKQHLLFRTPTVSFRV